MDRTSNLARLEPLNYSLLFAYLHINKTKINRLDALYTCVQDYIGHNCYSFRVTLRDSHIDHRGHLADAYNPKIRTHRMTYKIESINSCLKKNKCGSGHRKLRACVVKYPVSSSFFPSSSSLSPSSSSSSYFCHVFYMTA